MYVFIMVVHVFVSVVLILVILMQAGRGAGLSEMFGGGTATIFGTSTTKFLVRATAVCASLFIVTSLTLAVMSSSRSRSLIEETTVVPPIEMNIPVTAEEAAPPTQEQEMPVQDETTPALPTAE